ncbi:MAG: DNA repair protein RecN [Syntrophobacterales bacterium]|nr:MAG: DNA repair protein RecN [Syntrophobacterales bacterium]
MLSELHIKDFAIIDKLEISFSKGLNVLTGETGTGKSIIINAVNMILGDKASDDLIRTSAKGGIVEALFDIAGNEELGVKLGEKGFEIKESMVIKRVISRGGKSRAFINGGLATLALLSAIGEELLNIYGQHEHQNLQRHERHIDILDEFGSLMEVRFIYQDRFRRLMQIKKELRDLKAHEERISRERELMTFQLGEIESAKLQPGEDHGLTGERGVLMNAEKLLEYSKGAEHILYSGEGSVVEKLNGVLEGVRELVQIDPSVSPFVQSLESAIYQLEDIALSLRTYGQKVEVNPERLDEIEARLDEINRLKRKYGATLDDILTFRRKVEKELGEMATSKDRAEELESEEMKLQEEILSLAKDLSEKRRMIARRLEGEIKKELAALGMGKTRFQVRIEKAERALTKEVYNDLRVGEFHLTPKGLDEVEFLISPNIGEALKPLSKIASGGELSRIMLGMKTILTETGVGQTLIFDEVDAGIGGATAEVVGRRLHALSKCQQVLCVTHLPQIACFADTHHYVSKETKGGRTITRVRRLEGDGIADEIARMLGGVRITSKTRAHAREMIENTKRVE